MTEFVSLDLRILAGETAGYTVEAVGPDGGLARAPLNEGALAGLEPDLLEIRAGRANEAALERVGSALFQALFPLPVLAAYSAVRSQVGNEGAVRIRLHLPPELSSLPWELLYYPPTFLAAGPHNSIVRFIDLPVPPGPLAVQHPLRVLHLVVRPEARQEAGQLGSVLADLTAGDAVEVVQARPETLQKGLDQGCHVLHFSGQADLAGGEGHLFWEDGAGQRQQISGEELAGLLRGTTLRLALLDTIEPGSRPESPASPLVAAALVRGGLPAAVAQQASMPADSAAAFAIGFYHGLVAGLPVDIAVGAGRSAILAHLGATGNELGGWAAPALFASTPEGQVFVLETAESGASSTEPADATQISQEIFAQGDVASIGAIHGGQVDIRFGGVPVFESDVPPLADDAPYAAIRALLLEAYTPATLRSFCQDRPTFRPVINDFGPGQGFNEMVARVLDYCATKYLWHELLAAVREDNPGQYARFEDRLKPFLEGLPPSEDLRAEPPLDPLPERLDEFRRTVRDFSPRENRAEALARVAALKTASTGQDLDLETMAGVLRWFEEELPALSGAALSAVLAAESRAEQAGDDSLLAFRERFGSSW